MDTTPPHHIKICLILRPSFLATEPYPEPNPEHKPETVIATTASPRFLFAFTFL
jgi:hypothetical protein